jgi:hypothetical protein
MPYRFLFIALRVSSFACFAISVLDFFSIGWAPRIPDSTHIFLYKAHYLTREQVTAMPAFLMGFVILALASEFCRKRQPHFKKSKYFI